MIDSSQDAAALPDRFAGTGGSDPVPDGGILTVYVADTGRAGQTVAVTAADGGDPTEQQSFEVKLRGNGKGSALFLVPVGWESVVLSCAGSRDHVVAVAVPP